MNISLEELDYAFRHDRYSGEPIAHFQLFNSEYVAKVLKRYRDFIIQTKRDNNIAIGEVPKEREASEEDKKNIREEFLQMVFVELRDHGYTSSGWLLYPDIKSDIKNSPEALHRLYQIQRQKFLNSKPKGYDQVPGLVSVQNTCRSIVASNHLKRHLGSFDDFKKALHEE